MPYCGIEMLKCTVVPTFPSLRVPAMARLEAKDMDWQDSFYRTGCEKEQPD